MSIAIVVMAAGKGTRMKSGLAKVLHPLAGKPILYHLLKRLSCIESSKKTVIVGFQGDAVGKIAREFDYESITQEPQLGTAHALLTCKDSFRKYRGPMLVLSGDVPLISGDEVARFSRAFLGSHAEAGLVTMDLNNPYGYGRIVRNGEGQFAGIVEEKDASKEQKKIIEVNAGVYFFRSPSIFEYLGEIKDLNAQKEFYLPDTFSLYLAENRNVILFKTSIPDAYEGINTHAHLATAYKRWKEETINKFMADGVSIISPDTLFIEEGVHIEPGATICPMVSLRGDSVIGRGSKIYPFSTVVDSKIGSNCNVFEGSVIEGSNIENDVRIGPFSHIRPDTHIMDGARVGNFVETKKAVIHKNVKANHLSYLGDVEIGEESNVGAGTITCNYDGFKKHKTDIGRKVFIGSDTQLVAPVKVDDGAFIGAGSTITKDVPENALAVSRTEQKNIEGWALTHRKRNKKLIKCAE